LFIELDILDGQNKLRELLNLMRQGNEIIITERGQPIAKLIPLPPVPQTRIAGLSAGQIWVGDDFDDPLPAEFWTDTSPE